jgi:hypothetical protein
MEPERRANMTKRVLLVLVSLLLALVFSVATGYPADTLRFMEFYGQRVTCHRVDRVHQCEVVDAGEFDIVGELSLEGIDISQFNEQTPFHINIGGFSHDAVLGDDPSYSSGHHRARFLLTVSNGDRRTMRYLRILLNWNVRELKVFVRGRTPDFLSPVMAGDYVGSETGGISDLTTARLEFAQQVQVDFNVAVSGYVHTKPVEKWKQLFEVSSVWLMGRGTPPDPPDPPDPKCSPPCDLMPDGTCQCPR